jgi:hypothetical protein
MDDDLIMCQWYNSNLITSLYLKKLYKRRREQIRTRNDLNNSCLQHPGQSSWVSLYNFGDDESFINTVGINRSGFERLLSKFRTFYRHKFHLGRGGRPAKILPCQALGILLQFYASTSEMKLIAQLHGCRKNVVSRVVVFFCF